MTKVAIVTGATGGIGEKFIQRISLMDDIEEVWAVGRNREKLERLKASCPKVRTIEADIGEDGIDIIEELIKQVSPDIRMLINNAGVAYMGDFEKMTEDKIRSFCKVNCSAPSELMAICLPYMHEDSKILNISSASSFQPNPYLSMYSASKAYLKNLSRALNVELKNRKITVTSVCPYWVDTGMLPRERDGKKINYPGMVSTDLVVDKALKDSSKGKDMSVPGFFAQYFRIYSKITPTSIVMKQWVTGIRKYL